MLASTQTHDVLGEPGHAGASKRWAGVPRKCVFAGEPTVSTRPWPADCAYGGSGRSGARSGRPVALRAHSDGASCVDRAERVLEPGSMDDPGVRLIEALDTLHGVAGELTADEAAEQLDAATLHVYWREWPAVARWCGALWRRLNADLEMPSSTPADEDEVDELGGSG